MHHNISQVRSYALLLISAEKVYLHMITMLWYLPSFLCPLELNSCDVYLTNLLSCAELFPRSRALCIDDL